MTNLQTVQKSVKKMKDIETMKEDGRFEMLTKKERLQLDRQHEGLMKNLAGIRDMNGLPDMLFIIDVRKEDIAVAEANRLDIPVVAVVDTNCSPDGVDHVIPGNDDALRAIRLFASRIADAILEGQNVGTEGVGVESETGETTETEETVEPTIQVADQSVATVEETHPLTIEPTTEGKSVPEVGGAEENVEVKAEVETSASEDITEIVSQESAEVEESPKEESTEATAS